MTIIKILWCIFLILVIYKLYLNCSIEYFNDSENIHVNDFRNDYKNEKRKEILKKAHTTFKLSDIVEKATAYYNIPERLGLDVCLEKCKGNCVEFGITGKAFCF
jgi:hypothetical protein